MVKNVLKNKMYILILVCSIIITTSYIVKASDYEPGSSSDPVVTKSYVDMKIDQLAENVNDAIEKLTVNNKEENNDNANISNNEIEIVKLQEGQSIILESGSEIILRGGKATIIDSEQGGIADLTQGLDLRMDYEVPANHLLLIPRSDGRGVKALTNCILMVKGKYEIN
ncbi:hypothetical protein [Tepidibacter formicigenes]|jgi:hypothetical protein|uniref:Uncharacterized protein n=1 Tax=Tepidibacter formicigenes DSM 15518 TaxID=1123349 RepID=A0A1M6MRX1_9FIRM|nr:hypothetical protein [Tepidibacter formicigenes]SHJ86211.1 hypothetical protein SAMN02744037_01039 [Tepidibacter formicigenes DSM 15518]